MIRRASMTLPQAAFAQTSKRRKRIETRLQSVPKPPQTNRSCTVGDTSAMIRWTSRTGETYSLFRSTTEDFNDAELVADEITVNGKLDTGLDPETDYWYWVKATNEEGTSAKSAPIAITTLETV